MHPVMIKTPGPTGPSKTETITAVAKAATPVVKLCRAVYEAVAAITDNVP